MSGDYLELLLKYPLMRHNGGHFEGFIEVNDVDYELSVEAHPDGSFSVANTPQLEPHRKHIESLQRGATNLIALLDGLVEILSVDNTGRDDHSPQIYWTVLNEYAEFRQFYFNLSKCVLRHDLSQINITMVDDGNRPHDLVVVVDYDGPAECIFVANHNALPVRPGDDATNRNGSLKALYEQFVRKVESLQDFFDVMDVIDGECWVLDPEKPERKDIHRRISLGENTSVLLTFNPYRMECLPDFKLIGPERLLKEYHHNLEVNLQDFTPSENVLQDLMDLLGIENFPRKPPQLAERADVLLYDTGDCCICYSKHLGDKLPEIICSNKSCENSFHADCLHEWLVSINAQRSFNEITGRCPICEKPISCPLA